MKKVDAFNMTRILGLVGKRIRIKSIVQTKGEEVIKILINSYDLSPIKKLNSYMSDH